MSGRDLEVEAMQVIHVALDPLGTDARDRVLKWAQARYGLDLVRMLTEFEAAHAAQFANSEAKP